MTIRIDNREYVPFDWENPNWKEEDRVHNWRNYVSDEMQEMWHTFTPLQKQAIARAADEIAGREHWD